MPMQQQPLKQKRRPSRQPKRQISRLKQKQRRLRKQQPRNQQLPSRPRRKRKFSVLNPVLKPLTSRYLELHPQPN
jgi:hypothetical protein